MRNRFEGIVIEHGAGTNKHLFYVYTVQRGATRLWRSLIDSGMRTTLDDAIDRANESVYEHCAEPNFKLIIVNS
jgi:hypothetical protein